MRFGIQNKYQDDCWETIKTTLSKERALGLAKKYSKDTICYGMVRVIDTLKGKVLVTYAAGENKAPSEFVEKAKASLHENQATKTQGVIAKLETRIKQLEVSSQWAATSRLKLDSRLSVLESELEHQEILNMEANE